MASAFARGGTSPSASQRSLVSSHPSHTHSAVSCSSKAFSATSSHATLQAPLIPAAEGSRPHQASDLSNTRSTSAFCAATDVLNTRDSSGTKSVSEPRPRTLAEVDNLVEKAIECFTHRHLAHDLERQARTLKAFSARALKDGAQIPVFGNLIKLLRLVYGAEEASQEARHLLGSQLRDLVNMCTSFLLARPKPSLALEHARQLVGLASLLSEMLDSSDDSLHSCVAERLAELLAHVHKDLPTGPFPRPPPQPSAIALESPEIFAALSSQLAIAATVERQKSVCHALAIACADNPAACVAALDAGVAQRVLEKLRAVTVDTASIRAQAVTHKLKAQPPSHAPFEFTTVYADESSSDDDAPPRSPPQSSCTSASDAARPRTHAEHTAQRSPAQRLEPRKTQQRASQPSPQSMSQSLPQPPRAQGASFAVAPGRVVSADQLRLLSLQLQILDSLVNNAPRAGRAVVATHQGASSLLPLAQSLLEHARSTHERELLCQLFSLLLSLSADAAGARALLSSGVLRTMALSVTASLLPSKPARDVFPIVRIGVAQYTAADFEVLRDALLSILRCAANEAQCASMLDELETPADLVEFLEKKWSNREGRLQGWKTEQSDKLEALAMEILCYLPLHAASAMDAGGAHSLRAKLQSQLEQSEMGKETPILVPLVKIWRHLARTKPQLLFAQGVDVPFLKIHQQAVRRVPFEARRASLEALCCVAECEEGALRLCDQKALHSLVQRLRPLPQLASTRFVATAVADEASQELEINALSLALIAILSGYGEDSKVFEFVARQIVELGGMGSLFSLLVDCPSTLLPLALSILADWTRDQQLLEAFLALEVRLPLSHPMVDSPTEPTLSALALALRLCAANAPDAATAGLLKPPHAHDHADHALQTLSTVGAQNKQALATANTSSAVSVDGDVSAETTAGAPPADLLGKLHAIVMRARRTGAAMPKLAPLDDALLASAEQFRHVRMGGTWRSIQEELLLQEGDFEPVTADAVRTEEGVEAGVRAVTGLWTLQEQRCQEAAARTAAEEDEFFKQFQVNLKRAQLSAQMTQRRGAALASRGAGSRGKSVDERRRGKEFKEAMLAKSLQPCQVSEAFKAEAEITQAFFERNGEVVTDVARAAAEGDWDLAQGD